MSGLHSPYSPSSLYLTIECEGSLLMRRAAKPQAETPESYEGTIAHWVALQMSLNNEVKEGTKFSPPANSPPPPGADLEVNEEMINGAELWVETVGTTGAFEMPLPCPDVHPECWGTPDFWEWDAATRVLCVWDYKYGHRYVEEFENIQLAAYASGVIRMLNLPKDTVVQLGIVQPRCYMAAPVRQWVTNAAKVVELASKAGDAVTKALNGGACRTGPHCIDCEARFNCKALQFASNRSLHFIQGAETNDMSIEAIGTELSLLDAASDLVKARREALKVVVEEHLRAGARVPGWELKAGQSRLTWRDEVEAIVFAKDWNGTNLRKPAKLITPTQALSKKLVDQEFINKYASRPPAGLKLAPVSNVATRKIFEA